MGTTADKLQKALANKQSLVDIVNSKAGTSYTINSKPSDIVETINTSWSSIPGVTWDSDNTELQIDYNINNVSFIKFENGSGTGVLLKTNDSEITVSGDADNLYVSGEGNTVFLDGTTNQLYFYTLNNNAKIIIDDVELTSDMIPEGVTLFGITGTYKGSSSSATVEGNTLVVSGTVENNTLTLSNGSVEDNTLKL